MGGRDWNKEDLDKLRALAGRQPTEKIAQELNRNVSAIVQKAFRLRLSLKMSRQQTVEHIAMKRTAPRRSGNLSESRNSTEATDRPVADRTGD
jgi:hypothetical protein